MPISMVYWDYVNDVTQTQGEKQMADNRRTVTNEGWNYGGTSGYGIPNGKTKIQPFKIYYDLPNEYGGKGKFRNGDSYGILATDEEYEKIGIERGYLTYYTKNHREFVQSRRARKAGYQSTDSFYLRKASRQAEYKAEAKKRKELTLTSR